MINPLSFTFIVRYPDHTGLQCRLAGERVSYELFPIYSPSYWKRFISYIYLMQHVVANLGSEVCQR